MKRKSAKTLFMLSFSLFLIFLPVSFSFAQEYEALNGVKSVHAVFDMRIGESKSALGHLRLIQQTFEDKNLTDISKTPKFVVVFIGPSVKLLSKNRVGLPLEDAKTVNQIANTISEMSKKGIRIEICLVAAKFFGVEPASILPEVKQVGNGYISLIGYEAKGYSLVPVY